MSSSSGTSTRDAILALRRSDNRSVDVFESKEGDDGSQSQSQSSLTNYTNLATHQRPLKNREDVVQIDLKPSLAFAKFAGKLFDTKPSVSVTSSGGGSDSKIVPLTLSSSTPSSNARYFESPVDKFNRLKSEIQSFQTDLQTLTAVAKSGSGDSNEPVSELAGVLAHELTVLEQQLQSAVNDSTLRALVLDDRALADTVASARHGSDFLSFNELMARLSQSVEQGSQPPTIPSPITGAARVPASDAATIAASQPVLSLLDKRIATLEKSIGTPITIKASVSSRIIGDISTRRQPSTMIGQPQSLSLSSSLLWSNTQSPFPDLYTGLLTLHNKLSLIDSSRLESIHRAVKAITADLEIIHQHQSQSTNSGATSGDSQPSYSHKVNELFELVARWDEWIGQIPIIVDRLQSLRLLHEHSANCIETMKRLDTDTQTIVATLSEDRKALMAIGESMPANFKQMEENMRLLNTRIDGIQARIERLT